MLPCICRRTSAPFQSKQRVVRCPLPGESSEEPLLSPRLNRMRSCHLAAFRLERRTRVLAASISRFLVLDGRVVVMGLLLVGVLGVIAIRTHHSQLEQVRALGRVGANAPITSRPPGARHWDEPALVVYVDSSVDAIGAGAREALISAFAAWKTPHGALPGITFEPARDLQPTLAPDGRNTILVAPIAIPSHEDDLAVTISHSDANTGRLFEADIILNARHAQAKMAVVEPVSRAWPALEAANESLPRHDVAVAAAVPHEGEGKCECFDLENVMAHEAGHFFGFDENPDDPDATMYRSVGRCETKKRTVERDELLLAAQVYPPAEAEAAPRRFFGLTTWGPRSAWLSRLAP